ncbi:MAG: PAS domain S-box protein [Candidatus Thorarchaeota archaeon]|nr:PAS domain S-box protein [Candidatus Thorarchaeota archaeon]
MVIRSFETFADANSNVVPTLIHKSASDSRTDQYALILDALGDAIHVVNRDLQILFCNKRFLDWLTLLDLSPDILGKTVKEAFPFLDQEVMDQYMQVFNTGETMVTVEENSVHRRLVVTETRKIPIMHDGQVVQVVTVMRDLTSEVEAHNALVESEREYRMIFDTAADEIYIHDLNMRILSANVAACTRLGYSRSELTRMTIHDIVDSDSRAAIPDRLARLTKNGQLSFESSHVTRTGEVYPVEVKARLLEYRGEIAVMSIARDLTVKKSIETELEELTQRFEVFADSVPGPVFIKDSHSVNLYVNKYMREVLGLGDWVGKHTSDVLPSDKAAELIATDVRALEEGHAEAIHTLTGKDGTTRHFQTFKFSIPRARGAPLIGGISIDVTELERAERALRESETRYRLLYEHLSDALFLTDAQGRVEMAGKMAEVMFRYSSAELIGMMFTDLMAPESREQVTRFFQDASCRDAISRVGLQAKGLRADGSTFSLHMTNNIRCDSDGRPLGYQFLIRDITDSQMKEEELARSESMYRALFEQNNDAVFIVRLDGTYAAVNNQACRLLDCPEERLVDHIALDFVPSSEMPLAMERVERLMRGEEVPLFEQQMVRCDGSRVPVEVKVSLIRGENDQPLFYQTIVRDITKRKMSESELRKSQQQLQVIFDTIHDGIVMADEHMTIVAVNPAVKRLFGYEPEDLRGKPYDLLLAPAQHKQHDAVASEDRLLRDGFLDQETIVLVRKNGETFPASYSVSVIRDQDGSFKGLIGSIRDITDLTRAQRELEEARSRAVFFNDLLTHDLNNIHQGVLVGLELLLLDDTLPSSLRGQISVVFEQIRRAINLTVNVRKLSNIERTPRLDHEYNLRVALGEAAHLVRAAFPHKVLTLNIHSDGADAILIGDEFALDLWYNLLHNAVKFDPSDAVVVDVSFVRSSDGKRLQVRVMDHGPGIRDEMKSHVFDRLESGSVHGRGIGLTLAKRITERYGGRIWVEDRVSGDPAQGACMVVELPLPI